MKQIVKIYKITRSTYYFVIKLIKVNPLLKLKLKLKLS